MLCTPSMGLPSGSVETKLPANARDTGLIPGSGRSPGEGNGNLFQYSYLEIPWTEEPGGLRSMVSQSQTRLSNSTTTFLYSLCFKKLTWNFYLILPLGYFLLHLSNWGYQFLLITEKNRDYGVGDSVVNLNFLLTNYNSLGKWFLFLFHPGK